MNAFGGKLLGGFVFAERVEVDNAGWWRENADVAVLIQCSDMKAAHWHYPAELTATSQLFRNDPREAKTRQDRLNNAMLVIEKAMQKGQWVLFHCELSFHRLLSLLNFVHPLRWCGYGCFCGRWGAEVGAFGERLRITSGHFHGKG